MLEVKIKPNCLCQLNSHINRGLLSTVGLSFSLMKYVLPGILTFLLFFPGDLHAQPNTTLAETENVLVYPSIAVAVNKAVVIRLPKKATKSSCIAAQNR